MEKKERDELLSENHPTVLTDMDLLRHGERLMDAMECAGGGACPEMSHEH